MISFEFRMKDEKGIIRFAWKCICKYQYIPYDLLHSYNP